LPRSASSLVFIDPGLPPLELVHSGDIGFLTVKTGRGENGFTYHLPLEMALLRNLFRPECDKSVTRFYGNQEWEEIKGKNRSVR